MPELSRANRNVIAVVGLAALIFAIHWPSLTHGLFMDDYAHYGQLRAAGWSLTELADACRLELVGPIAEYWWLPDTTLRFFRPVSFGIMKAVYVLSDWSPAAQHAASLVWHWIACLLILALLRRCRLPFWLALSVTGLFAIHPGQVASVQWVACQTEVLVTVFTLLGTLCYARWRDWGPVASSVGSVGAARTTSHGWLAVSLVFFALALGSRENAIMFPVVLVVGDAVSGRLRAWRSLVAYALFGALCGGYLVLRTSLLDGMAVPPRPYIIGPHEPDFLRFIVDKFLYYVLGEFLTVAVVPIGGLPYLRSRPLVFYGAAIVTLILLAVLCWTSRRQRATWLGAAWFGAFILPLLPAFASPHHLYLPGVGWALIAGILAQRLAQWRRWVAGLAGVAIAGYFIAISLLYSHFAMLPGSRVEDRVIAEILDAPVPVESGDTLYIGNLPMIAHYVKLAVEQEADLEDLRVVPLTWAPRLLGVFSPSELRIIDDRTIETWVTQDRFFSGPFGRLVREATGRTAAELTAEPLRTDDFTVQTLLADDKGLLGLRFVFHEPLDRPGVHVFWGSQTRWATQVVPTWAKTNEP